MENENIYGSHLQGMEAVMENMTDRIALFRKDSVSKTGYDPIDHVLARIKSDESMREKLQRKGFPVSTENALSSVYDAIGIRVVCPFVNDVYAIVEFLRSLDDCSVFEEKDYIRHAKVNGYRSFHIILQVRGGYYVEFQVRTVSMDTWAALEHLLRYKHAITNQTLIESELKRCADELASTDASMQTIRDMIRSGIGISEKGGESS